MPGVTWVDPVLFVPGGTAACIAQRCAGTGIQRGDCAAGARRVASSNNAKNAASLTALKTA